MSSLLKLPFALRGEGLVHISEVSSGRQRDCVCPSCKEPLIAKKGPIKKHHFAHDPGTQCNLESALHCVAKTLIYTGIQGALNHGNPIHLRWKCSRCGDEHGGNLLKRIASVNLELDLGKAQPDILLSDLDNKPIAVIEIVVSHPPDDSALEFYKDAGIAVVEVKLESGEALEAFRDLRELHATRFPRCTRPKCKQCGRPLSPKVLHVVEAACEYCLRTIKLSFVDAENLFLGPRDFTLHDILLAEKQGCVLQRRYSERTGKECPAIKCSMCGGFVEEFSPEDWYEPTSGGPEVVSGHFCRSCEVHFD
ncbi:MAG: hypothetical protein HY318_19065 [Armatimonadetes bacterium]|nr:hypothetical protein [Armatimonadota bacterium]